MYFKKPCTFRVNIKKLSERFRKTSENNMDETLIDSVRYVADD